MAEATAIETRRVEVAEGLMRHETYRSMAHRLAVSAATISTDVEHVRQAWQERYASTFAEHCSIELAKLDRAERMLWTQIDEGKAAIDTFVKVSRRRSVLLGLDRPQRIEAVMHHPPEPDDGRTIVDMLRNAMAQAKATNGDVNTDEMHRQVIEGARLTSPPAQRAARAFHELAKWDEGDPHAILSPDFWLAELDDAVDGDDITGVLGGIDTTRISGNDAD